MRSGKFRVTPKNYCILRLLTPFFKVRDIQEEEISSSQSVLPKEILGSLVLEALDGFMFIVKSDGKIDFVSDNVKDFLGFPQDTLTDKVIYNYIHQGDHARFSVNLEPDTWKTWKRIPQNRSGRQVFDRSKVFHLRFRLNNNAVKSENDVQQRLDLDYENMQVSAIVMLNPIEEQGETPKSGLFCIARKINANERSELTPVEQFTTKASRDTFVITTVDTSGLPDLYVKNIESQVLGKTLLDLVHPHDVPLLREHIRALVVSESDTSKVYRMVLPPPHNVVHVKTKSRIFTPQPGFNVPGYIMSTHAIIRENELNEDDLPGLRPQLRGMDKPPQTLEQMVMDVQQQSKVTTRVNSPQVQSPPLGANQGSRPPSQVRAIASSPVPSSSPTASASTFSTDLKTELFTQLLSPPSQNSDVGGQQSSKLHFPPHHNVPTATSPSNGGNELLKELLKPKEDKSRDSAPGESWAPAARSGSSSQQSSSDNVTLVGLLNERPKQPEPPSELLKQLRAPPRTSPTTTRLAQLLQQGHKRPSSSDEGPANKQPPSLEKLLESRPDSRPIPPLPRKWSEVPQDKLPRDIVIDNRPPNNRNNNAGRARVLPSTFPSSSSPPVSMVSNNQKVVSQSGSMVQPGLQSRIVQNTRPSPMETTKSSTAGSDSMHSNFPDPSFNDASEFRDLMTDPVFSKILDNILVDDTDNNDQRKQQKIQRIEEELQQFEQLEQSSLNTSGTNLSPGMQMVQVQAASNQTRVVVTSSGPPQYAQPGVIRQQSAPQQGRQQILQQRGPQGDRFIPAFVNNSKSI